ncbi:hypothetical protein LXN10_00585 [Arcobacter sp. KX21116]|jgi:hypothetical protein|uniref:hypothetical protein n=1 Tax=Arcobacter iocasae TaxID=2906515 RepID=UPI0035D4C4EB|tara:strand:+ start:23902 stop:25056 length:1155 start_codon:yes stop_codon:yes gene_type:complete
MKLNKITRSVVSQFSISDDVKNLNLTNIKDNLFSYKYDIKRLSAYFQNPTEELEHFYSSFKGEVYENIIYELLLEYAKTAPDIKKFILKGPHQKRDLIQNKSGLLIDNSNQIVYKASYKDISEFDALFFTNNEIYFVEMSTSKKTASLNKRLFKKQALLKVLFPYLEVKALIVLTKGSVGLNNFPSYCTVWVTNDFEDEDFLKELIEKKRQKKITFPSEKKDAKFIEANTISHSNFKYFQTLKWILYKARSHKNFSVDLGFFNSKDLNLYFDIYTKLYIGYLKIEDFRQIAKDYDYEVRDDKVIVSIEKINQKTYGIIYYPKNKNGQLKRVKIDETTIKIKDKEAEGFTNAEIKFMLNVLDEKFVLTLNDINHINKNISIIKTF